MLVLTSSVEAAPSTVRTPSPVDVGPGHVTVLDGQGVDAPVPDEALVGKTIVRAADPSGNTQEYWLLRRRHRETALLDGAGRNVQIETCLVRPGTCDNNLNFVFRDAKTLQAPVESVRGTSTRSEDAAGERTVTAPGSAGSRRSGTGLRRRRRPAATSSGGRARPVTRRSGPSPVVRSGSRSCHPCPVVSASRSMRARRVPPVTEAGTAAIPVRARPMCGPASRPALHAHLRHSPFQPCIPSSS